MSNHVSHDTHHQSNELPDRPIPRIARDNNHHSMIEMSFHTGFIETILFDQWMTASVPVFICSWIFIFILGMLYEGIKEIRQSLEEDRAVQSPTISDNENELELMNIESSRSKIEVKKKIPQQYTQRTLISILYTVQLAFSYILMLIVMTFNVYLFFAIIFGVGTGHLLYGWARQIPTTDKNQSHA